MRRWELILLRVKEKRKERSTERVMRDYTGNFSVFLNTFQSIYYPFDFVQSINY